MSPTRQYVWVYKVSMIITVILCINICIGAEDPDPNDGMWVDDDWTGYNYGDPIDNHVYGVDAFYKIQDAIDCSAATDVIHVYPGNYTENINANKNLDFIGIPDASGNLPVICPGTLTGIVSASATSNGLIVSEITGMDLPSATDICIHIRITRLSASGDDTIADTVELSGLALQYVSNKLGLQLT